MGSGAARGVAPLVSHVERKRTGERIPTRDDGDGLIRGGPNPFQVPSRSGLRYRVVRHEADDDQHINVNEHQHIEFNEYLDNDNGIGRERKEL